MISILSINHNTLDWMQLLVASVRKFTTVPHEIIIVDNASEDGSREWLIKQDNINSVLSPQNIGHGPGLDCGLNYVTNRFCLVLDIDAHLMREHGDFGLLDLFRKNPNLKLAAAKGGDTKPIHPCLMFFDVQYFREHGLRFVATKEHDVGRKLYYDISEAGGDIFFVPPGYEKAPNTKFYEGAYGDIYYLNQKPLAYHNWYGSRMWKKDKVDSLTRDEFEKRKKIIFEHPKVKEILA